MMYSLTALLYIKSFIPQHPFQETAFESPVGQFSLFDVQHKLHVHICTISICNKVFSWCSSKKFLIMMMMMWDLGWIIFPHQQIYCCLRIQTHLMTWMSWYISKIWHSLSVTLMIIRKRKECLSPMEI